MFLIYYLLKHISVTLQVLDSSPPTAARTFFNAVGMAACGCHAHCIKKLLRTAAGSEET